MWAWYGNPLSRAAGPPASPPPWRSLRWRFVVVRKVRISVHGDPRAAYVRADAADAGQVPRLTRGVDQVARIGFEHFRRTELRCVLEAVPNLARHDQPELATLLMEVAPVGRRRLVLRIADDDVAERAHIAHEGPAASGWEHVVEEVHEHLAPVVVGAFGAADAGPDEGVAVARRGCFIKWVDLRLIGDVDLEPQRRRVAHRLHLVEVAIGH